MATFIASALTGVEAEDAQEAHSIAQHEEVRWEVTGVATADDLSVVLSPAIQLQNDPRREKWPLFGKASAVLVPLLAYGAYTGESGIRALAELAKAPLG